MAITFNNALTAGEANRIFTYDEGSGVLRNKVDRGGSCKAGEEAGTLDPRGYRRVCVHGERYWVHRVAVLMATGKWPEGLIDHVRGVNDDNRASELRVTDSKGNSRNSRISKANTSGVTGVSWSTAKGKWYACICVGGRTRSLGRFDDFSLAVAARRAAEVKHGFHENHGRA